VDVLVVFDIDENIYLFDAYFELKERLEAVCGRGVDKPFNPPFSGMQSKQQGPLSTNDQIREKSRTQRKKSRKSEASRLLRWGGSAPGP
jgi:hypothetical protein